MTERIIMKKRKRRGIPSGEGSGRNMQARQKRQRARENSTRSHQYIWSADCKMNTAWFYIPLRLPLRLPDRFVLPIGSPYNLDYPRIDPSRLIGFIGSPDEPFLDDPIGVHLSICVHQIEGIANIPEVDAAFAATRRRPWLDKPDISPFTAPIKTTVLECCVSLGEVSPDNMDEARDRAFDTVLSEVNGFLRGYMILTGERVALVHRETRPFSIPYGWSLERDHESDPGPEELALYPVNTSDPLMRSMSAHSSEDMSEDEISQMLGHSDALGNPLIVEIHTMTVDAQLALHRGEYAVAVVLLASSCELLVRLLLEVLLWEDGVSPRDASSEIYSSRGAAHAVSHILKSKFHNRLGGTWDISSTSKPVGRMYQAIFEKRNSYLHSATQITEANAKDALDAGQAFLEFVRVRLKAQLRTYSLAAHMFIGEPIMAQMGIRNKIEAALREKETKIPLNPLMYNCSEHLKAYRQEIRRYQIQKNQTSTISDGKINEQTHVAALIYPDSSIEYWLIDLDSAVACRAETPTMSARWKRFIKKLARDTRHQPANWLNTCRLLDTAAKALEPQPKWVPVYEVLRMEHKQD